MSELTPRAVVGAAVDCLCKQDIPEVLAVVRIVEPMADAHWREAAGEASRELERQLEALEDQVGTPDVDVLAAATSDSDRRRILSTLTAAFLLTLTTRVAAPFSPARQSAIREASSLLVRRGAASLGLPLDPARPGTQEALAAAERDLQLLLRGRLEQRIQEAEGLLQEFLTSRAARTPATGRLAPLQAGTLPNLEQWRERLRAVLGLTGRPWLPQTVDVWAYRWFNVGSFLAVDARPSGLGALLAVNNPPAGPDPRTTPFCRHVHGRVVSMSRARQQVDRYVQASLQGDVDGVIRSWPLLTDREASKGTAAQFTVRFQQLGLPPYHWRCRTIVQPRTLARLG